MSKDSQQFDNNNTIDNNNQGTIQINLEAININLLENNAFTNFDKSLVSYNSDHITKINEVIVGKMNLPFYTGFTVTTTNYEPNNLELLIDYDRISINSKPEFSIPTTSLINQHIRTSIGEVDTPTEAEGNIINI